MLKIKHVSKSYGKFKAIDDINLNVKPGLIYGCVGHNGAGKTTLIKSIVGIHQFDQGDILIDNHSIVMEPIICKQQMAYVPDNPDIYESLTGIAYLNFIANIYQVPVDIKNTLIKKYSVLFEIEKNLGNPISSYSHGMKQKLVLISALIHQPKLLVLDEPFVGLDPKASFNLKTIMKEFCAAGGSIFFSSHVLEVVEKLCDEIILIKQGKVIISGPTKKVLGNKSLESLFMELTNE